MVLVFCRRESAGVARHVLDPGHFRLHVDEMSVDAERLAVEGDERAFGE